MDTPKMCPICNSALATQGLSIGTCKPCRKVIDEDIAAFMRCIEEVMVNKGHPLEILYNERRTGDASSARRLLYVALHRLAGYNSSEISSLLRIRGKGISDSNVRHHLYVARDYYKVSKAFVIVLDDFLADIIRSYKAGTNLFKKLKLTNFDVIVKILMEADVTMNTPKAIDITNKILIVLLNMHPNEIKKTPDN